MQPAFMIGFSTAMELRHIRYFLAVAEEQNFTRAAARVGIGQPPLSQQIKDLETEVGAPLFHRIPQGAELTEAGRAFLENVRVIPVQAERATRAAQRAARGEIGSIRVGFVGSAPFNRVMPATIRSFRRAYPDVEMSFEESNAMRLIASLKDGELDAAFFRVNESPSDDLQIRLLSEERMVVVLPATHPAAKSVEIDLVRLRNDALILVPRDAGPSLFDTVMLACRQAGFEPILGQSAPQLGSVVSLVAAELGFSMVPESMRQLQLTGVTYREVAGDAPLTRLALAYRRGETSKIVRNFVDLAVA
jgi:DNA-binding transcriptional LysR family regulator